MPRKPDNNQDNHVYIIQVSSAVTCKPGLAGFIEAKDDGSGGDN